MGSRLPFSRPPAWRAGLCLVLLTPLLPRAVGAQRLDQFPNIALTLYLRSTLAQPVERTARAHTEFRATLIDLNGDGRKEAVVYLTGSRWCSAGGCELLVATQRGRSFEEVGRIANVTLPIRALPSRTNGWRDLGVLVQTGSSRGYTAVVPFTGHAYATNAAAAPSHKLSDGIPTEIVITEDQLPQPLLGS